MMKSLKYVIGIISLSVSVFSGNVQADGVTLVKLSSSPLIHVNKASHNVSYQYKNQYKKQCKKRVSLTPRKPIFTRNAQHKRVRSSRVRTRNMRINKRAKLRAKRIRASRIKSPIRYHYIRNGDSLYKIAKKYKVTVKYILQRNKLKSSAIKVGGRLII